jgi:hypothetical protein
MNGLGWDDDGKLVGMKTLPIEGPKMDQSQQNGYLLHVFVSNQSLAMPIADLEISINGRKIFHQEMTTGTQHNWEQVTIQVATGKHMLVVSEAKTQTRKSVEVNVDRELWIVVRFDSPPAQFIVDVFDHPVAFM